MTLAARRVDPLTVGDQLKALFVNNERPDFPSWYDRAYPTAVKEGAASWVLSDETNTTVAAHVGGFTARFLLNGREVRGGLLVNLMADKEHRTFFPVVSVVKRAVKDIREAGAEFLYTNPINPGAIATMRAAGLKQVGATNRFLLPLGHRNPIVRLGVRAFGAGRRLWLPRVDAHWTDLSEAVQWTTTACCRVAAVTPRRLPTVYPMRQEGFGTGNDFGIRLLDSRGEQVGAAIVRLKPQTSDAWLTTIRCLALEHVAGGLAAVGALLTSRGVHRLEGGVLMGTPFARELARGGFLQRKEPWAIVSAGFTEAGREIAAGIASCDLESIDLD